MFSAFLLSGFAMVTKIARVDQMRKTAIQVEVETMVGTVVETMVGTVVWTMVGTVAAITENVDRDFLAITLRLTQNLKATLLGVPMQREDRSHGR